MTDNNGLSLKARTKLLKKVIQKKLVAEEISISSRKSEKEFRFWLQKISPYVNGEREQIERKGNSLAEEIIQLCQQQQTLNLDKTVINSLKSAPVNLSSLNPVASKAVLTKDASNSAPIAQEDTSPLAQIGTTEAEREPALATGANTYIGTTEVEVEVELKLASEATEANQPTSTTESLSNLPPEFLELLNGKVDTAFEQAWAAFDEQLAFEPSSRPAPEEILPTTSPEELVFIVRGHRGLAIANQKNQSIDYAVAQMPALNVGSYRELQSGLVMDVGYGDDGKKYITQWGNENRGGIQIEAKTILLFVRA